MPSSLKWDPSLPGWWVLSVSLTRLWLAIHSFSKHEALILCQTFFWPLDIKQEAKLIRCLLTLLELTSGWGSEIDSQQALA